MADHTAPAIDDDVRFRAVQSAVLAKVGITEIRPGVAAPGAAAINPVNIRMNATGKTFTVHHTIAIRRILDNLATLV